MPDGLLCIHLLEPDRFNSQNLANVTSTECFFFSVLVYKLGPCVFQHRHSFVQSTSPK